MDRFVTRAPTWKTLNYSSMAAQKSSTLTKKSASKPLQQKQLSEVTKTYDFNQRSDDLFRLTQANAENFNGNSNDSGLSSASSISPQQFDEYVLNSNASPSKNLQTPKKNYLGKLGDYVDCPTEKENDMCMTITRTPKSNNKKKESVKIVEKIDFVKTLPKKTYATPEQPSTTAGNMIMARIQRDLNSPSAAVRVRALKAIKSPTKSVYSQFDVPEAEQSLHFAEPPSLQEIMRNIVVYVEVRSGEDNRSAGVRKVIEALGARVNLSLKSDTTHVVFKDGLLSTFKKATQLGVPVVSILWIEACKTQGRICDAKDYPISNLDRYENPELYTKMKRVKSMQPDSECNRRIRAKAGGGVASSNELTPTQKTAAAGAIKKTSTFIDGTPTSSTNKKKTDISQFFKKLDRTPQPPTPTTTTTATTNAGGDANGTQLPESPATQLLNRISSECYTPLEQWKQKTNNNNKEKDKAKAKDNIEIYDEESREGFTHVRGSPKSGNNHCKKALDFLQISVAGQTANDDQIKETPQVNTRRRRSSVATSTAQAILEIGASLKVNMKLLSGSPGQKDKPQRRHSLMPAGELETAMNSMNVMTISNTPSRNTRRRSSIHSPRDMTMETPTHKINIQPAILEEANEMDNEPSVEKPKAPIKPPRSINKRRTLYAATTMDQTDVLMTLEEGEKKITSSSKSTRRRTIYASKTMETTELQADNKTGEDNVITSKVTNRRRTCYSHKTIEQTDIQEDIREKDKPKTKETKPTQRRRTLYTPQKLNDTEITSKSTISPNVTSGSCVTPTNFVKGKITCSTFLEDSTVNRSKLVATPPPADATVGKLLEETEECATPLIFSSTRQPGNKRRTLFDVSMDIITQRLQCINQSARKSLAPLPPSTPVTTLDNVNQADVNVLNTPQEQQKTNHLESYNDAQTPQSSLKVNSETKLDKDEATTTGTPEAVTIKKKRKLFMPNEMLLTPPATTKKPTDETDKVPDLLTATTAAVSSSVTKRRRTLMPISQPQPNNMVLFKETVTATTTTTAPSVTKRRSTLDFEQIQNINTQTNNNNKSNNNNKNKLTTLYKNKKTEFAFDSSAPTSSTSTNIKLKKTPTKPTIGGGSVVKAKKMPVLVYTNMHSQQIDVIREAITKLGTFSLESCVTDGTTHLVSLEPRRTLNLLRALVRGLWIVEYSWILESVEAGKWLPEEPYELRDFSRSIEICRSERQAFGERYKCELFHKIGSFYITSSLHTPMSRDNLCELVRLCGGRVVANRQKARYIIGDAIGHLEDKIYVTPFWILDSITQMQLMKIKKYTYPLPTDAAKPLITQETQLVTNSQI